MKCLIIAAGRGSRISKISQPKPLVYISGTALIERVIGTAQRVGITEFVVVIGCQAASMRTFLKHLGKLRNVNIDCVFDEQWGSGTGVSVRAAKDILKEHFILLMADHLFDEAILKSILNIHLHSDEVALAVDLHIENTSIDKEDATKVLVKDGLILDIGKQTKHYNGFDTGISFCSPVLFEALEGASELSEGVKRLANSGKAKAIPLNGEYWIDIDDEKALKRAEKFFVSGWRRRLNVVS